MRLDHDFGDYTTGGLVIDGALRDALDRIPELSTTAMNLSVLFAYAGAEGLLGGRVDAYVGRQLEVQTLDWFSFDGAKLRVQLPGALAAEVLGGLRVRDSSPLGSATFEPSGTSGALCQEYVEGDVPGSGAWRPIDVLPATVNRRFRSDYERCPQRVELMPTFGAALATRGLSHFTGRVAYRRSQSRTPGIIGPVDRFEAPDVGLYPNEEGQAPDWGVNEERLAASVSAPFKFGEKAKPLRLIPYAALRYSLLHGLVDEALVGTRTSRGQHALETELFYSFPTFDGDSIFNVFSSEPYVDMRLTYALSPRDSPWRGYARTWGRRYHSEDSEAAGVASNDYSGGVQGGVRLMPAPKKSARLDVFHEGGYGGRRTGGYLMGRLPGPVGTRFFGRLSVIRFRQDLQSSLRATTLGAQLGVTAVIATGAAATLILEENSSVLDRHQLGAFLVLDLAFQPET
jgi:hypothetical protein